MPFAPRLTAGPDRHRTPGNGTAAQDQTGSTRARKRKTMTFWKPVQPVPAKAGKIVPIRTEKRGNSVSDQFKKQHLSRPRTHKRLDHVERRIGRLRKEHSRVAPNYEIIVTPDDGGTKAVAVTWELKVVKGSMVDAPGRLLPAFEHPRLGRGRDVAHAHHAHRRGGRVPVAQIRTRPASRLSPEARPGRRPPLHLGHRLPGHTGSAHAHEKLRSPR